MSEFMHTFAGALIIPTNKFIMRALVLWNGTQCMLAAFHKLHHSRSLKSCKLRMVLKDTMFFMQ